jgi:hypothetical protein
MNRGPERPSHPMGKSIVLVVGVVLLLFVLAMLSTFGGT